MENGKGKKKAYINFRLHPQIKDKLKMQSENLGVTMTEIIERKIMDSPLIARSEKNVQFIALHGLANQINYIGKNINQITVAIRQLRADKKMEDGEFIMLRGQLDLFFTVVEEVKTILFQIKEA